MRQHLLRLTVAASWFIPLLWCAPEVPIASTLNIPRVSRAPRIVDFLEGTPREAETRVDDFRQRQPNDGQPASLSTTAYLSYDDHTLYAIFVCRDEPAKVRAHMGRRESISGDDIVGIALDTMHDRRRAYMFYANPLGVQLDGISAEGQPDDYKFDAVWSSEGRLTKDGFIVRFAIPFRSLQLLNGNSRTWGIALTRSIPRRNEYSTWPRITDKIEAYIPQFGTVNAPVHNRARHDFSIIPYGFLSRQTYLPEGTSVLRRANELRAGADVKIGFGGKLTLDLTANPDFSQIESDEPQVTVNQRYENFFPEKRPFFLENATLFQTPERIFFSRRIIDPEFGARLSGKVGSWTIGVLAIDDRAALRSGEADSRAMIGVARVQREFGRESSVGFLLTSRRDGLESNQVAAADLRWKLNSNWVMSAQSMRSDTAVGSLHSGGDAWFADLRYVGRHFNHSITYRDRSPNFAADLGFIPRVDIRQLSSDTSYRWRPETGRVTSFGPSIYLTATKNRSGELQDWQIQTPFWVTLKGPTSFFVEHTAAYEVYEHHGFRRDSNGATFSSDYFRWLGVTASLHKGKAINYYPAAGLTPTSLNSVDGRFEMTLRPTSRARIDETYFYTRLSAGSSVFLSDHVFRSKLNYQFSRTTSARAIVDYHGELADASRITVRNEKRLTMDLLFTWLLRPGTALYAGYTDRRENLLLGARAGEIPLRVGGPDFSTGRQVFVKISYLFRP